MRRGIKRGIRYILEKNAFTVDEIATKMQISLEEAMEILDTDVLITSLTIYEAIEKFIHVKTRGKRWKLNKLGLLADPSLDDKLFTLKKKNQTFQNILARGNCEYDLRISEMKRSVVEQSTRIKRHHDTMGERVMQRLFDEGYVKFTSLTNLVPDGLCRKGKNTLSVEVKMLPKDPLLKVVREVDGMISALKYISEFDNCWLLYNKSGFIPTILSELGYEGDEFVLKSIPFLFARCIGKIEKLSQEEIERFGGEYSTSSSEKIEIYGGLYEDLRRAISMNENSEHERRVHSMYRRKRLGEIRGFMGFLKRNYKKFNSEFMPKLIGKGTRCYFDSTPRFEGDRNLTITLSYLQIGL